MNREEGGGRREGGRVDRTNLRRREASVRFAMLEATRERPESPMTMNRSG